MGRLFILNWGGTARSDDAWIWIPAAVRRWLPFVPQHDPRMRRIPGSTIMLDAQQV